ncbi:hypothetical protein BJ742DRAFT_851108 [Cladochytrium replicatum]|nr:hypothetical protein BJ742DRAFT_851108 [Cladochytrium replicatum]
MAATASPDATEQIDQEAKPSGEADEIQTKPRNISTSLPQLPRASWESPAVPHSTDPSDPKRHVRPSSYIRSVKRSQPGSSRTTGDAQSVDQTHDSTNSPLLPTVTEGSVTSEPKQTNPIAPEDWIPSDFSGPDDLHLTSTDRSVRTTKDARGQPDTLSPAPPKESILNGESKQETMDSLDSVYLEAALDIIPESEPEKKPSSVVQEEDGALAKKVVRVGAEKHRIPSPPNGPKQSETKRPAGKKRNALPVRAVPTVSTSETSVEGSKRQPREGEGGSKNQRQRRSTVAPETKVGDRSGKAGNDKWWENGETMNEMKKPQAEGRGKRRKRLTTDTTAEAGDESPNVDALERKPLPPPRKLVDLKDDSFQFALDQFIKEEFGKREGRRTDLKQKLHSRTPEPELSSTLDFHPNRYVLTVKDDGSSGMLRRDSSEGLFDRPEDPRNAEAQDSNYRTRAGTPTPLRESPRMTSPAYPNLSAGKSSAKRAQSTRIDDSYQRTESYAVDEHRRCSVYRPMAIHSSRIPRFKRTRFKGISTSTDFLLPAPNTVMDPLARTKSEILKRTSLKHIGSAQQRVESGNFLSKLEEENEELRRQISALGKLIPKEESEHYENGPSVQEMAEGGGDHADWEAGATFEDKLRLLSFELKREQEEKQELQDQNKFLNIQVNTLRKRVNREIEKAKMTPRVGNTRIPISVEANMNLRYQFKQKLEIERAKYAKLEEEHKRVATKLRDMQIELNRKIINVESQRQRMNGIAFWQKKHRDVENEKHDLQKLYDALNVRLEKQSRENERLRLEIQHMTDQLSHLQALSTIPEERESNPLQSFEEILLGSTESDLDLHVRKAVSRHRRAGTKNMVSGKSTRTGTAVRGSNGKNDGCLSVPLTRRPSLTTDEINQATNRSRKATSMQDSIGLNINANQRDKAGQAVKKQRKLNVQDAVQGGAQSRTTEIRKSGEQPSLISQEKPPAEDFVVRVEPRETAGRYEISMNTEPKSSPERLFEDPKLSPSANLKVEENLNANNPTSQQFLISESTKKTIRSSSGDVVPSGLSDTNMSQQSTSSGPELQNSPTTTAGPSRIALKPPSLSATKNSKHLANSGTALPKASASTVGGSKIPLNTSSLSDTKKSQQLDGVGDTQQNAPASTVRASKIPLNTSSSNRGRSVTVNKTMSRSTGALSVRRASLDANTPSVAIGPATKNSRISLLQAAENDEGLRAAKVQIEYKTWVKDKG